MIDNLIMKKTNSTNLKFISNDVKGMQKSVIKIFEYLKKSISPNGFTFLQEADSFIDDKKSWCKNGNLYFSH